MIGLIGGKKKQIKYLVIMCDTFDWVDYACFCNTKEEVHEKLTNPGHMQKVMEIYEISTKETISKFDFY